MSFFDVCESGGVKPPESALLGVNLYRTVYMSWQVEKGLKMGYFSPKMAPLGVNLYRICCRRRAEKGAKNRHFNLEIALLGVTLYMTVRRLRWGERGQKQGYFSPKTPELPFLIFYTENRFPGRFWPFFRPLRHKDHFFEAEPLCFRYPLFPCKIPPKKGQKRRFLYRR